MKRYYFYKTTNNVNGKYYYGVHTAWTKTGEDFYLGSGTLLIKAIKKYGKENFSKEIIQEFDTIEEAYKYEEEHVTLKEVQDPNCYNVRLGGMGGIGGSIYLHRGQEMTRVIPELVDSYIEQGWELGLSDEQLQKRKNRGPLTEEHKAKISAAHKGKKLSEETRLKLSRVQKGRKQSAELIQKRAESNRGQKRSEETKRKISEANKGHPVPVELRERWSRERKGTVCIWKDGEKNKHIHPEDLQTYLNQGWQRGSRYRHPAKVLVKMSEARKNLPHKIAIHNQDGTVKRVLPEQLTEYLASGWIKGTGRSPGNAGKVSNRHGKIAVWREDCGRTYISEKDLQDYLNSGYIQGYGHRGK